MKKYLIAIVVASIFSGPALAYDKALAESYEKFFSAFEEKNVPKALRRIPADKVVEMIKKGDDLVIIDVRTCKEQSVLGVTYEHTLQMAMNEIFQEENLRQIPTDKKVILTCKAGLRCAIMAIALHHVGFDNMYSMKGGITAMNHYLSDKTAFSPPPKNP